MNEAKSNSGLEEKFHKAKQFLRELNDAKKKLESDLESYRSQVLSIVAPNEQKDSELTFDEALSELAQRFSSNESVLKVSF